MMNDEVLQRLDRIAAVLSLAFADRIASARQELRSNAVIAAILDTAVEWTPAGELQEKVAAVAKTSTRTVRSKLAELVAAGAVQTHGAGPTMAYRSTGLV